MTNEQRSQEYYRLALKCHELSQSKRGCDHQCARCTLNVNLYVDDIRDATLIKTSAGIDWQKGQVVKAREQGTAIGQLIWSLVLLIGLALAVILPVQCVKKHFSKAPTMPVYEAQELASTATPEVTQKVLSTCEYVRTNTKDVNKSGKIDCIDYALTFYEQYGSEAKLIWWVVELNKRTHLLCAVPNGYGQLLYIEPNRIGSFLNNVIAQKVYLENFDLRWCKDVTADYQQIKNRTMYWRWP